MTQEMTDTPAHEPPPSEDKTRVVLIDDDALVRAGLKMILGGSQSQFEIVAEGSDGSQARELVITYEPDVVLMDIRMPHVDGITATCEIMSLQRPPIVVMLTTFDSDDLVLSALRAGAHSFLLKDTPPSEMVNAIHAAVSGERALSPRVLSTVITAATRRVDERYDEARGALDALSERELEVAIEIGRGLSNAEIAKKLYQSLTTVKATVTRILTKLGCTNRTQVALLAHDARLVD